MSGHAQAGRLCCWGAGSHTWFWFCFCTLLFPHCKLLEQPTYAERTTKKRDLSNTAQKGLSYRDHSVPKCRTFWYGEGSTQAQRLRSPVRALASPLLSFSRHLKAGPRLLSLLVKHLRRVNWVGSPSLTVTPENIKTSEHISFQLSQNPGSTT